LEKQINLGRKRGEIIETIYRKQPKKKSTAANSCSQPFQPRRVDHHGRAQQASAEEEEPREEEAEAYPHLSQSTAKPPDRSGQPFLHSPPAGDGAGAPHAAFMHLFAATNAAAAAAIPAMATPINRRR
jgi:hypothetical protein